MKLPKQQMEAAFADLKEMSLEYTTERAYEQMKNYEPSTVSSEQTAYLNGKLQGVIEFLHWAKKKSDGQYHLKPSEAE